MSISSQSLTLYDTKPKPSIDTLRSPEIDTFSGASHVSLLQDNSSSQVDSDVTGTSTSNRSSSFTFDAQKGVGSPTSLSSGAGVDSDDSSLSFKRCLLENLNNESALGLLLMPEEVGDDIVFWQHDETRYHILGSDDRLDHPGTVKHWEETDYIQIEYEGSAQTQVHQRFSSDMLKQSFASDAEVKGDFFLPLGWLVELGAEGTKRATRYVCMLNISIDPLSLWLMFDYLIKDSKGQIIKISDLTYIYNNDFYRPNPRIYNMTRAKDAIGHCDLLRVYKNIADWDLSGKHIETTTENSLLEKPSYSFHLGSSIQAIRVVPPKSLLNHVTKPF